MSNKVKTFFLVSGWDFPIDSIQLGSIIASPSFPQRSFTENDAIPIDTKVHVSEKYDFSSTLDKSKSNKFGLWAQFLQIFGLGAEASVSFDKGSIDTYAFQHMKTEWFLPSKAFVKACVKNSNVVDFLEQTNFRKPLYIITGLKTVEGASVTTVKSKGSGVYAKLGFDGTPAAVPVTIGPEVDRNIGDSETASFENSSPVVFAFQLTAVRCKEGSENVKVKDHTKGALFGFGEEREELEIETEVLEGVGDLEEGREIAPVFDEDGEESYDCVLPH
ncbi:hypothetical protein MMC31_000491 [Peltigera leucophlebia]|nr:hypothetical protein [Peltigera leucophlebia]